MAQSGFTPIKLYRSSTAAAVPLAADLAPGELAINTNDGKLFYEDSSGVVQVIGWKTTPATAGGTGQTSYAVGDLLYAPTTTTVGKLADIATGNALISGGVGAAPSYGKIGLTTHVSGTLPVANGGTNATTASITSFNNITGYSASGATGTTSTNLVFSTSPTLITPAITTSLTTGSTTFALLNTTATTLNIGGAATVVSIGAATGTLTVNNISVANTFGFKNRIINGAFNVGQYSVTSTSGASTVTSAYVTDRWIAQAISSGTGVGFSAAVAAATLPSGGTQNALTVTQTQTLGTSISISQRIEAQHLTDLYDSMVTLSYYVSTSASANIAYAIYYAGTTADTWQAVGIAANTTTGATLLTVSGGISTTTSLALKTLTFSLGTTAPTRGIEIIISTNATNGQSMTLTGMQLERGGAATSFDYRPYTTELTLASRYFGQHGTVVGTSTFTNTIVPRTAMRATPTVSAVSVPSGTGAVYSFSTYLAATGFGAAYQSTAHSITEQAFFTLNSEL